MIDPVVLKGFRDSLPAQEIPKRRLIRKLEDIFALYGFSPIDTPALEYTSVLLGKGGGETDKQIFHFTDNGGREVALRFDLTVPFARFVAAHSGEISRPFKRYHINKVWRGENPQKGRYREFYQCDFDIVGVDNEYADSEILSTMAYCMREIFQGDDGAFRFHLAHRGLFNDFLEALGVRERSVEVLRAVDKLRKIGREEVARILSEETGSPDKAERILSFITVVEGESFLDTLGRLEDLIGKPSAAASRLRATYSLLEEEGIAHLFSLDPSITCGLDYYTGIVYETFLTAMPSIGSVCSGGRYNNLASLYTKEELPGVGSSIGLDRLLAALEELGSPILASSSGADLLIVSEDKAKSYSEDVAWAGALRKEGLRCDLYPFNVKKMKAVYDYSGKNSIPFILVYNWKGERLLKDTRTQESLAVKDLDEVTSAIKERLH